MQVEVLIGGRIEFVFGQCQRRVIVGVPKLMLLLLPMQAEGREIFYLGEETLAMELFGREWVSFFWTM